MPGPRITPGCRGGMIYRTPGQHLIPVIPRDVNLLWDKARTNEAPVGSDLPAVLPPVVVGNDIVITTGNGGVVEARNQIDRGFIWSKYVPLASHAACAAGCSCELVPGERARQLMTNLGICHYTINGECPDWCYECSDTPLDCSQLPISEASILQVIPDWGVFVTGATIDAESEARVYFGTMDGRFIALELATLGRPGMAERSRGRSLHPAGRIEGRPWYDQKFAWHLSPPSVYDGKLYFGSFLPSFYYVFKAMPFVLDAAGHSIPVWPSFNTNFKMYWVGRMAGRTVQIRTREISFGAGIPRGCGVTNIPPVANGKVFFNADTVIDYHYGQMAACDVNTGAQQWQVGPIPLAQGGNPAISIPHKTIFYPEGDGAVWAVDLDTGKVKWTYFGGFCVKGATGVASSMAIDEARGWVLGASDTGHLFVLDMDTGKKIRETYHGSAGLAARRWGAGIGFLFSRI